MLAPWCSHCTGAREALHRGGAGETRRSTGAPPGTTGHPHQVPEGGGPLGQAATIAHIITGTVIFCRP